MEQEEKVAGAVAFLATVRIAGPASSLTFRGRPLHPGTFVLVTARTAEGDEDSFPVQACSLVSPAELRDRCLARCRQLAARLIPHGDVAEVRIGDTLDGTVRGDRHGEASR